jgi:UDP:flavonoid glycosyltransferase YjiC (YdhE family)
VTPISQPKILLIALGSRGDIEPFLAVGQLLKRRGYQNVACVIPEQFRKLAVDDEGLHFYSLGTEFLEMLDTSDGRDIVGADLGRIAKLKLYYSLYKKSKTVHDKHMAIQSEAIVDFNPDLIIYHVKSIYPSGWEVHNPGQTIMLSPVPCIVKVTSSYPVLGFNFSLGTRFNRFTYGLTNSVIRKTIKSYFKRLPQTINLKSKDIKAAYQRTPMLFGIDAEIFPRDESWTEETHLVGYLERDKSQNYQPPESLVTFLQKHKKVLLLTFGSMINPSPESKTRILLDILKKHNIPTVINTAAGGLVRLDDADSELFYFVRSIPYDWLLPQIYGVIHHGGSGTTHLCAKYACAAMIIPHIIDQHLWNTLNVSRGLGPKGVPIGKLSPKIEEQIIDLYNNRNYHEAALTIAGRMHQDANPQRVVTLIENHLKR